METNALNPVEILTNKVVRAIIDSGKFPQFNTLELGFLIYKNLKPHLIQFSTTEIMSDDIMKSRPKNLHYVKSTCAARIGSMISEQGLMEMLQGREVFGPPQQATAFKFSTWVLKLEIAK